MDYVTRDWRSAPFVPIVVCQLQQMKINRLWAFREQHDQFILCLQRKGHIKSKSIYRSTQESMSGESMIAYHTYNSRFVYIGALVLYVCIWVSLWRLSVHSFFLIYSQLFVSHISVYFACCEWIRSVYIYMFSLLFVGSRALFWSREFIG